MMRQPYLFLAAFAVTLAACDLSAEEPFDCPGACPVVAGYDQTCNAAGYCEYERQEQVLPWHEDDVWIYVPPGTFVMGGSDFNAMPHRDVTFAEGYLIGKFEVTIRMHNACLADESCDDLRGANNPEGETNRQDHPRTHLNFRDSGQICEWLNARRPSEAEWERAAKGSRAHAIYPWGQTEPNGCDEANWSGCSVLTATSAVGSHPAGASPFGVMDMGGNVAEWVEDCWHQNYNGAPVDGSAWVTDCYSDNYQVAPRGGDWTGPARAMHVSSRFGVNPAASNNRGFERGVRCARSL